MSFILYDLLNNNFIIRHATSLRVIGHGSSDISKTAQMTDTVLGCQSQLHGKALLLKTPHIFVGCRTHRNPSQTDWGTSSLFCSLQRARKCSVGWWERAISVVLPSVGPCICNTNLLDKMSAFVQWEITSIGSVTTFWLDLRPAPQEGISCWYCNSSQKHRAWEIRSPRTEPAVVILLNGHLVKLSSKYLCLHP